MSLFYKKCEVCGTQINKLQKWRNIYTLKTGNKLKCPKCGTEYKINDFMGFIGSFYAYTGLSIIVFLMCALAFRPLFEKVLQRKVGDEIWIYTFVIFLLIELAIMVILPLRKIENKKQEVTLHVRNQNNGNTRDYDQEPIVVKNYAVYFEGNILYILTFVVIYLWIGDLKNIKFEEIIFYSFDFLRMALYIFLIFNALHYSWKVLPKRFKNLPSTFIFTNHFISHTRYLYDDDKDTKTNHFEVDIKYILQVNYCVMTELPDQYGRWNVDSTWKRKRKFAKDIDFGEFLFLIYYTITYLFVLPYKVYRLIKAKESLGLLSKNIFIQFTNRNYFLVNIYSQKELDELLEYFQTYNIPITNETYFIPHLQNQGWFVDKNEIWTDEFENQGENALYQSRARSFDK